MVIYLKKKSTSERLIEIMNSKNLRQVDILNLAKPFCEKYNIKLGKSDLSQFINGKVEPGQWKLTILSLALNVSEAWLMGFDVPMERLKNTTPNPPLEILKYNPTHKTPILGCISAGLPLYAEENIEGYTYTELNGGAEYFALRVTGDSMTAARIYPSDILIVRRQEIVENGEIAIVMVDDENATVKRFNRDGDMVILTPQSTNPEHQVQVYNLKNTNIRVIGKVVRVEYSLE